MFMLWISAAGCAVAGVALLVAGLPLVGGILLACGVGMAVLALLLRPVMQSSRRIAEQSGMEVNRLTGAPKLGSSMRMANERMQAAQQQMSGLMGNGVQRTGSPGSAMVVRAEDTGGRSNMNPVYAVELDVTPAGGATYRATVTSEVNSLAIAQCVPGTVVSVKIDQNDPNNIWVDWLAVAGSG